MTTFVSNGLVHCVCLLVGVIDSLASTKPFLVSYLIRTEVHKFILIAFNLNKHDPIDKQDVFIWTRNRYTIITHYTVYRRFMLITNRPKTSTNEVVYVSH